MRFACLFALAARRRRRGPSWLPPQAAPSGRRNASGRRPPQAPPAAARSRPGPSRSPSSRSPSSPPPRRRFAGCCPTARPSTSRRPTSFRSSTVSITFKGGASLDPADVPGLASMTARMVREGGTEKRQPGRVRRDARLPRHRGGRGGQRDVHDRHDELPEEQLRREPGAVRRACCATPAFDAGAARDRQGPRARGAQAAE